MEGRVVRGVTYWEGNDDCLMGITHVIRGVERGEGRRGQQ